MLNLDTEATLQAEFYHACRLIGLQCALEVVTPAGRHDAIALNDSRTRIIAIIEVKRSSDIHPASQLARYAELGIPVHHLTPATCPHALAASIKQSLATSLGVTLQSIALNPTAIASRTQRKLDRHERRVERLRDNLNIRDY